MPREMGIFRKIRFEVNAYPVDYRTASEQDLPRPFSALANGLKRVDREAQEWKGLVACGVAADQAHCYRSRFPQFLSSGPHTTYRFGEGM